jgi:hypothetical protein
MPHLPVGLNDIRTDAAPPGLAFSALLIDGAALAQPPGWLPVYLAAFEGEKIILPPEGTGWVWPGGQRSHHDRVQDAVAAVRQLAEGQSLRGGSPRSPWVVAGYILGALFGLQLLLMILGILINSFS